MFICTAYIFAMKYKTTRYKTLIGVKEVLEFVENDYGQWIVYQDNKPKFHIDCFDYSSESNRLLNDWIYPNKDLLTKY